MQEGVEYDAIVIGSGVGGLTAATGLCAKGAKVALLEKYGPVLLLLLSTTLSRLPLAGRGTHGKNQLASPISRPLCRYIIPGGSAGMFQRGDYTFDVGSSMMFGFGDEGYLNLLTRALAVVGKRLETIPDPNQITYHLPPSKRFPEVRIPTLTASHSYSTPTPIFSKPSHRNLVASGIALSSQRVEGGGGQGQVHWAGGSSCCCCYDDAERNGNGRGDDSDDAQW